MLISIAIPCYNSSKTLPLVVEEIQQVFSIRPEYEYQILLVNDNSPDNTYEVIGRLCAQDSNIIGIDLSKNYGQASAQMAAIQYAKGDIVVYMDDDGQHPARHNAHHENDERHSRTAAEPLPGRAQAFENGNHVEARGGQLLPVLDVHGSLPPPYAGASHPAAPVHARGHLQRRAGSQHFRQYLLLLLVRPVRTVLLLPGAFAALADGGIQKRPARRRRKTSQGRGRPGGFRARTAQGAHETPDGAAGPRKIRRARTLAG